MAEEKEILKTALLNSLQNTPSIQSGSAIAKLVEKYSDPEPTWKGIPFRQEMGFTEKTPGDEILKHYDRSKDIDFVSPDDKAIAKAITKNFMKQGPFGALYDSFGATTTDPDITYKYRYANAFSAGVMASLANETINPLGFASYLMPGSKSLQIKQSNISRKLTAPLDNAYMDHAFPKPGVVLEKETGKILPEWNRQYIKQHMAAPYDDPTLGTTSKSKLNKFIDSKLEIVKPKNGQSLEDFYLEHSKDKKPPKIEYVNPEEIIRREKEADPSFKGELLAYYNPIEHKVVLPNKASFKAKINNLTQGDVDLHEIGHSLRRSHSYDDAIGMVAPRNYFNQEEYFARIGEEGIMDEWALTNALVKKAFDSGRNIPQQLMPHLYGFGAKQPNLSDALLRSIPRTLSDVQEETIPSQSGFFGISDLILKSLRS